MKSTIKIIVVYNVGIHRLKNIPSIIQSYAYGFEVNTQGNGTKCNTRVVSLSPWS